MAAVGNLARMRSNMADGAAALTAPARAGGVVAVSVSASSGIEGSWPTMRSVLVAGGTRRIRSRSCAAEAWYTRSSKLTGGVHPSPAWVSCHVSRARRAVESRIVVRCAELGTGEEQRPDTALFGRAFPQSQAGVISEGTDRCRITAPDAHTATVPRASWHSRARAPSPSSRAAARRVALVELVHQAPEPVRADSRLGGLAGDLAGWDDRPPPVIQPHGGEDGHLGVRPLEQDPPGHPAGLAAYDLQVPVVHGRGSVPDAAARFSTRAAAPAARQQDAIYRKPQLIWNCHVSAVARMVTGLPSQARC